jgi:hypothetical protein
MDKLLKYLRKADYSAPVYNPPQDFRDFFIKRTRATDFIGGLKSVENRDNDMTETVINEHSKKECLQV